MKMVKEHVDLRNIEKCALDNVVVPTGLADQERLDEAYIVRANIWNPMKRYYSRVEKRAARELDQNNDKIT